MSREKFNKDLGALREALRENSLREVHVKTYGCQQNESDSERIKGIFQAAGCAFVETPDKADIVVFNTCAVRKTAEGRIFGHIGSLKKLCEERRNLLFIIGGCMVQQKHIAEKIKESYPYVDILFNTNAPEQLPGLIVRRLEGKARVFGSESDAYKINEWIPTVRDSRYRALIPIMYGCDNYCSYCVVPLVRGPERSRASSSILSEFKMLVDDGYKDIMLLGQNVNSYGRNLSERVSFSELLRMLNDVEGDFVIRFMTSNPKDATAELFKTIADCGKISRSIHLPAQSGSDRVLKEMNRNYTKKSYLALLSEARSLIKDVTFTSDILIGYPGETEYDYRETVDLVQKAQFYSLFTFIYSKREGTKAALLPDTTSHKIKADRLIALTKLQDGISERYDLEMIGRVHKGIVIENTADGECEVRLDNNSVVVAQGDGEPGVFCNVRIKALVHRRLHGEIVG